MLALYSRSLVAVAAAACPWCCHDVGHWQDDKRVTRQVWIRTLLVIVVVVVEIEHHCHLLRRVLDRETEPGYY